MHLPFWLGKINFWHITAFLNLEFFRLWLIESDKLVYSTRGNAEMSTSKMSTPELSTVPKCLLLNFLLCQNVYSWNFYCAEMSTVPKCLLPKCLLCQNIYSRNVYCAKMSSPEMSTVPKCLLPKCLLCQNVYSRNVNCPNLMSTPEMSTVPKCLLLKCLLCVIVPCTFVVDGLVLSKFGAIT